MIIHKYFFYYLQLYDPLFVHPYFHQFFTLKTKIILKKYSSCKEIRKEYFFTLKKIISAVIICTGSFYLKLNVVLHTWHLIPVKDSNLIYRKPILSNTSNYFFTVNSFEPAQFCCHQAIWRENIYRLWTGGSGPDFFF